MTARIGRYVGLTIVTTFAAALAIMVTVSGWGRKAPEEDDQAKLVIPKTPVSVMKVEAELIEITDAYSGMIRPWERFSLGFEKAGRVVALGTNADGEPLDEGDRVEPGQLLAQLDDRVVQAQLEEAKAGVKDADAQLQQAKARLTMARSDLKRSQDMLKNNARAIALSKYQDDVTKLAVAEAEITVSEARLATAVARLQTADKSVKDTRLLAPNVAGVLSKRMVNPGESVTAHKAVMEIIQVDEVLLVASVPEAYVSEIRVGQPARVELLARNRFGRKRPETVGRVHRVAESADQTTGLFEVEIAVSNPRRIWKPGLIALARIVIDRIQGHRVPATCAVFRDDSAYLFAVDKKAKARRIDLDNWIEQGSDLIIAELPPQRRTIVRRGQHRLIEGREVKLVKLDENGLSEPKPQPVLQASTPVSKAGP